MTKSFGDDPERKPAAPFVENLGRNCIWWSLDGRLSCNMPNAKVEGRRSCEGVIDDVCLDLLRGRQAPSLTESQRTSLRITPPGLHGNEHIPPGDIV